VVCNSGVGLTPIIDGRCHHFSAGGLYNGLVLLIDDETRSYWDHITGTCVHGPMSGHRMPVWNVQLTTVAHALEGMPDLLLLLSRQSLSARLISWFLNLPFARTIIPPGFRKTMGPPDNRLDEMQMGLGLISGNAQRFYPLTRIGFGIEDNWLGQPVHIRLNPTDGIPDARFPDQSRPLQLFTRWYGFSYTFPQSEIYGLDLT